MNMVKTRKLSVLSTEISIVTGTNNDDYICLTDMVKASNDEGRAADIIKNWIRNRATIEFLGAWEMMYNPNFKVSNLTTLENRQDFLRLR